MIVPLAGCNDDRIVYLLNWGDYLDKEVKDDFEARTGITVRETIVESNEEMIEKLMRDDCRYDLCIPSDYAVEMLVNSGRLAELDMKNIPNIKNIDDEYLGRDFDPENKYSVPYTWGVMGLLYNKTKVDEADLGSWDILWNEKYAGEIYMYDSLRDTLGAALCSLGYSLNSTDPDELREAGDRLIAQKPLVKGWGTDDNKDRMVEGEGAVALVFNGDAVWCTDPEDGNPDLGFYIPSNSNIFLDSFVIPKTASHKKYAEKFINFLLDPEIAARNIDAVGYSTPNSAAFELLEEHWKNNPTFNIPKDQLTGLEIQRDLGEAIALYEEQWERIFMSE